VFSSRKKKSLRVGEGYSIPGKKLKRKGMGGMYAKKKKNRFSISEKKNTSCVRKRGYVVWGIKQKEGGGETCRKSRLACFEGGGGEKRKVIGGGGGGGGGGGEGGGGECKKRTAIGGFRGGEAASSDTKKRHCWIIEDCHPGKEGGKAD